MSDPATYAQLQSLLRTRAEDLKQRLNVSEATFLIPTDGKGLRITVSVPADEREPGEQEVECELLDGQKVTVKFEVRCDYCEVEPLDEPE